MKNNNTNWPTCSGIYKIVTTNNNKVYIGSAVNLQKRLNRHFRELKYNYHFNQGLLDVYNLEGINVFKVEILETFDDITYTDLLIKEDYYIDKFHALDSEYGYNHRKSDTFPEITVSGKKSQNKCIKNHQIGIVLCDAKTGLKVKEFESCTAAANFLKSQTTNIAKARDCMTKTIKGYTIISSTHYKSDKLYKKERFKKSNAQKELYRNTCARNTPCFVYDFTGKLTTFVSWSAAERELSLKKESLRKYRRKSDMFMFNNKLFCKNKLNPDDFEEIWETLLNK